MKITPAPDLQPMWIKICANTNLEDALLAAHSGADALGFVFAPSRRQVTASAVAAITPHLPANIERIGVFPSLPAAEIAHIVHHSGLTGVQLHGGFDPALTRELGTLLAPAIGIIQTVHWHIDAGPEAETLVALQLQQIAQHNIAQQNSAQHTHRVLIDSKVGTSSGGTGTTFPWASARAVFANADPTLQLILAGGLRPENVDEAIRELAPWGVDVASGVELKPGRKSPEKLAAFLSRARAHAD